MRLTMEQYPRPSPGIVGQLLNDEAVLLRPEAGKVSVLNEVAARIWQLADGTRSIQQIAELVASEYQVDLPQAEADTLEFVEMLIQKGMLVAGDHS